jgi:hypothetical protein
MRVFLLDTETGLFHAMPISTYQEGGQEMSRLGENGSVVGSISCSAGTLGFYWNPDLNDQPVILPPSVGTSVDVTGVNVTGQLAGKLGFAGPMFFHELETGITIELGETTSRGRVDVNDHVEVSGTIWGKGNSAFAARCSLANGFNWQKVPSKYSSFAEAINNAGQICGSTYRTKQSYNPSTVFIDDPVDGYFLLDTLVTGTPDDVALWLSGETNYDSNNPLAISETVGDTGYGYIAGYRELGFGGAYILSVGFVLTPEVPAP